MKHKSLTLTVLAATVLSSHATLLLHYTFDDSDATNSGSLGDGTPAGGGSFVPSTAGPFAGNAWQGNRVLAGQSHRGQ